MPRCNGCDPLYEAQASIQLFLYILDPVWPRNTKLGKSISTF